MKLVTPRNELKFYISSASAILLEHRLRAVLSQDEHTAAQGSYVIRSLYFDDPAASAFFDKINGVEKRAKYRIRFYNDSLEYIRLEKKEKVGNLSFKSGMLLSISEANALLLPNPPVLEGESSLFLETRNKIVHEHFSPLLFVDYTRRAFCFPAGNVRVTLDSELFATKFRGDFHSTVGRIPVLPPSETILEIKFDSFFPPFLSKLLEDVPKVNCAVSKFCKCREALS